MSTRNEREIKAEAYQLLENTTKDKGDDARSLLCDYEAVLAEKLGLSHHQALKLITQYIVVKRSAECEGGITSLPDFDFLPTDSGLAGRYASFVWAYVGYRIGELPWKKEMLFKRAHFDLGNSDEETEQLLKWANDNPHIISDWFEHGLAKPTLSSAHKSMLDEFQSKLLDNSLRPIN